MMDPWGGPEAPFPTCGDGSSFVLRLAGRLLTDASCILGNGGSQVYNWGQMLRELKNIRQIDGERRRRWFADDEMDLILWFSPEKRLDGFEICYDKLGGTRTITWKNIRTGDGTMKSILMSENALERKRIQDMLASSFSTGWKPTEAAPETDHSSHSGSDHRHRPRTGRRLSLRPAHFRGPAGSTAPARWTGGGHHPHRRTGVRPPGGGHHTRIPG